MSSKKLQYNNGPLSTADELYVYMFCDVQKNRLSPSVKFERRQRWWRFQLIYSHYWSQLFHVSLVSNHCVFSQREPTVHLPLNTPTYILRQKQRGGRWRISYTFPEPPNPGSVQRDMPAMAARSVPCINTRASAVEEHTLDLAQRRTMTGVPRMSQRLGETVLITCNMCRLFIPGDYDLRIQFWPQKLAHSWVIHHILFSRKTPASIQHSRRMFGAVWLKICWLDYC
jgi:hypothetical protein